MIKELMAEMERQRNPAKAAVLSRFFRCGKGQYGEGDVFLGITVPAQRQLAKKHQKIPLPELSKLLHSKVHEHRLTALLILTIKYPKNRESVKKFYCSNLKCVNNWDLVDLTAPAIIGDYLAEKEKSLLKRLASSSSIWERRIAIVSTLAFVRKGNYKPTLDLCCGLMNDKNDLIHKASGWMLREVGKRSEKTLREFLDEHSRQMPRTMLRYSIERLDPASKKKYMSR
ncbi:MAG: DNA alkylation repair protein [Candidatus Diapherotrites archaeon]|uniref:DNA alkylation repair protein n=1 Tax=Candidatus Iainarchaeum sp. TaxID=3101447 RepID=A0A8T3YMA0_9ARCH|nr:DNA alkylation repair protein [Candidatus Diapherotrites archaeon]